jgi:beta-lactamase superfamily II metal-dependent hydrolase
MATTKKTKAPAKTAKTAKTKAVPARSKFRARVRMYRQGLGDCFLITLPGKNGQPFYMLIDCGVILGTASPGDIMSKVVQNITTVTGGHIHLLVATHEHWDHLSGFVQATALFQKLTVDEVWVAWTEDPQDALAQKLRGEHQALRVALGMAQNRMRLAGAADAADEVQQFLEFFGTAGSTTGDALKIVKGLSKKIRYCRPGDAPVVPDAVTTRFYVLGPPHDEAMIKRFNPSAAHPETYGIDDATASFAETVKVLTDPDASAPFDTSVQIPTAAAQQMPFFVDRYWGEDSTSKEKDQSWRTIESSWLDSSSALALQLDSATNNTSLVLALELDGGDVLLFAADAQVGNWLSWQSLVWGIDGKNVTGPDLLKRAILYKVGHHGSHNATLRENGLEMMTSLKIAMIPVNHEMALKKRWGAMPLPELEQRLDAVTGNRVLRIDQPVPSALAGQVLEDELFYEITL